MIAYENIEILKNKIRPTDVARATWRIQSRKPLHPAVAHTLKRHEPENWVKLFWQWPYVATTDDTRLAYIRDERALVAYKQTITSVPKYLAAHFPHVPSNLLRDYAMVNNKDTFALLDDMCAIIHAIDTGPWSCMQSSYNGRRYLPHNAIENYEADKTPFETSRHPYSAYDPKLGWKLAVRRDFNGKVAGRALVYEGGYVRTYMQTGASSSIPDPQLIGWLDEQGYEYLHGWEEGTELADNDVFPYLDGDNDRVDRRNGLLVIDDCGTYKCNCTDGTAEGDDHEGEAVCSHCGDWGDEYGIIYIDDACVCSSCVRHSYTYSHNLDEYIKDDNLARVGDNIYRADDLPDDIVELDNGRYANMDDCVIIDSDWYRLEDTSVVYLDKPYDDNGDENRYALVEDCWKDSAGTWHHDSEEYVFIDDMQWAVADCEYDAVAEEQYAPGTEMETLPSGLTVHPSNPCLRQLELV